MSDWATGIDDLIKIAVIMALVGVSVSLVGIVYLIVITIKTIF